MEPLSPLWTAIRREGKQMVVIHKKIFLKKEGNILVLSLVCKHFSKEAKEELQLSGKCHVRQLKA